MQKRIPVSPDSTRCSTCMLSEICLPLGMARNDISRLDELIKERIRLPKGTALFHLGDKTEAVYGIRSGSIKTQLEDRSEEHTSELQSRPHLVCRLLLEKKKK